MIFTRDSLCNVALACFLFLGFAACSGSSGTVINPDDQFGHRVDGSTPDGRSTIVIQAPEVGREYNYYPAIFQSVNVRAEPSEGQAAATGVSVEVLVKGAFPDACTELHDVNQERAGNVIRVVLRMRRPVGAVCASVLRPYRFYLELDGVYAVGAYSLLLNDESNPFEIRAARASRP